MNRRHFIAGAAAAAQSVFGQGTADLVGTGQIGIGNRGSQLLKGILEQPNAKVVALCDIKPDKLDQAASAAAKDNPATYSDWRKVIERADIDAVFISTPPYLHSEMAIAALKAGKNVYCEKPVGVTAAQVRDLLKAAKSTNKVFQAGQQLRSMHQLGQAIARIQEGAIGDILMIKAQRHAVADIDHNSSSAEWYFNYAKSGGYLVEQSVHNLDLCNWVIGNHPVRVAGFGGIVLHKNDPPGRDIMDSCSLTYQYPNGIDMAFTQMVFHPRGLPLGSQSIYVYGSKGAVDLMSTTNFYSLSKEGGEPAPLSPKQEEPPHAHITKFYECIQKGSQPNAGIVIGATAALTAIMGSEACIKQKIVNWTDLGVDV